MKSILDSSFKYTPSTSTDVRKTFAKVVLRQERLKAKHKEEQKRVVVSSVSSTIALSWK